MRRQARGGWGGAGLPGAARQGVPRPRIYRLAPALHADVTFDVSVDMDEGGPGPCEGPAVPTPSRPRRMTIPRSEGR
jgi:hypothetical protein